MVDACLWGNQYADLVLQVFASLQWPDPNSTNLPDVVREGITRYDLPLAFIVC